MDLSCKDRLVGIDTETSIFSTGFVIPDLVCVSMAGRDPNHKISSTLAHVNDKLSSPIVMGFGGLENTLRLSLVESDCVFVGVNAAFDWAVICRQFPSLIPHVFDAYQNERILDLGVVEKLYRNSTTGDLEWVELPSGGRAPMIMSLLEMEKRLLGRDRSKDKNGEDSWRLRYIELIDKPLSEWPEEAKIYALEDAEGHLLCGERLFEMARPAGEHGSIETAGLHSAAAFVLFLATARGVKVDRDRVVQMKEKLEKLLSPERMKPLYDAGILTPADPGRPKARGDGLTKAQPEKMSKKALQAYLEKLWRSIGKLPMMTSGGAKGVPQISTASAALETFATDPLCALLLERDEFQKHRTTYIPPLLNEHGIVHFPFDALKETGRTSSYIDDKYASMNGQNPPRASGEYSIRECIVAREGYVLCSIDYSGIELATIAQKTYSLFGFSRHRDLLLKGYDLHAYLGSRLAAALDPIFSALVRERSLDEDQTYLAFIELKKGDDASKKFYKHWRTFAKPVGLGYPGGLGAETFVTFAKASYGVEVTVEQAIAFKEVWLEAYPEMSRYFSWIGMQHDPANVGRYQYMTPCGMLRVGISWTEAANGCAMQSPAAEGAKIGLFQVSRAIWADETSTLFNKVFLVNFVHDEIILEIENSSIQDVHQRAFAAAKIWVDSMRLVLPDVPVKAEPALMLRWYKDAEPVYNTSGELIPWEPKK